MREPDRSRKSAWWRVRAACTALARDRDGSALFYTTLSLPVLVGFAVLAIDGSRLMNLQSHLQHAADAMALAAAGELDPRPDACDRAVVALSNIVENYQRFGEAGLSDITKDDVSWRFLSGLPANDADPIPDSMVVAEPCTETTAPQVRFVEVKVDPQTLNTLLPASFIGGNNTAAAAATAVAGFEMVTCKIQPLFMCNPFEPAGNTDALRSVELFDHIDDPDKRRRQIEFKKHSGGTAQWSPGNFGFLEADLGPGADKLGQAIATVDPGVCSIQNGVYTKPGNTTVSRHAFNVRFDIYHGKYKQDNAKYPPAPNVRKGFAGGSCGDAEPVEPPNMSLPRDSCFAGGSCTATDRIGTGDWDEDNAGGPDFEEYWTTNFGTSTPRPTDDDGVEYSDANLPTRYEIYRYEIENGLLGTPPVDATTTESGAPQCYTGSGESDDPERRIVHGAIMNCIAQPIDSGASGGPYIAVAFGKFFMTEPMDSSQSSLWVELADVIEAGSKESQDLVQLYR